MAKPVYALVNGVWTLVGSTTAHTHTVADVTGLQAAIDAKANIASPTFTGTLTADTVKITGGVPGIGKVLTSDADGDATWEAAAASGIQPTLFDAKGDLIVASAADTAARLAAGTDGQVLATDSAEATGLKWVDIAETGHTVNTQTGTSYTLALADNEKLITLDNAASVVVTVPDNASVALPVGAHIYVAQIGIGRIVLEGSATVLLNGQQSLGVRDGYGIVELLKVATDEWSVSGDWESPPTPAFVSATTSAGGTSIAPPAGIQEGDLLIGLMGSQNGAPTLAGFTMIASIGGGLASSYIFVKRATSSEPGSYAITGISAGDEGSLHLSAWRNAAILESASLPVVQTIPQNSAVVFPEQDLGSPGYPLVQTVKYDSAAAISYTSADNYTTLYSVQVGGVAGTFAVRATTDAPVWVARQLTMTPPTNTGSTSSYAGCQRIFIVWSDQTAPTNVADFSSGSATDGFVATADGAGGVAWEAPLNTGHTIEDETVAQTQRTKLNFAGAGVTVTDDAGNNRTIVTIPGGIQQTLFDAKGDILVASAADTAARLPAGTNGQILLADSAEATGLKWVDSSVITPSYSTDLGAITGGVPVTVTHNLNTYDVVVQILEKNTAGAGGAAGVVTDATVAITSANAVDITFVGAAVANLYRVTVVAVGGTGSGGPSNYPIVDAKGDLIVGSAADTAVRLAAGPDYSVLLSAAAAPNGIEWSSLSPQTYTPTLSGFIQGNGTVTGRYAQLGKLVFFSVGFVFGTTSTAATAAPKFSLPVTSELSWAMLGSEGQFLDTGVNGWDVVVVLQDGGVNVGAYLRGTTAGALALPTTTSPFTWGVGDAVYMSGIYFAA